MKYLKSHNESSNEGMPKERRFFLVYTNKGLDDFTFPNGGKQFSKNWNFSGRYEDGDELDENILTFSFDEKVPAEYWADEWAEGADLDRSDIRISEYVIMSIIRNVNDSDLNI